jgi:tRNA threonylcarbamoyladenosine biosynthesis protein TsaB
MIILGVDTTDKLTTVVLSSNYDLIAEISILGSSHNSQLRSLIPVIHELLGRTIYSIRDVELLIVVTGPGNWTGLRIGVVSAKEFSHALKIPIVGVCALDVLAYGVKYSSLPIYTIIDGSKENVYNAKFDCSNDYPIRFSEYKLTNINEFINGIASGSLLIGSGSINYKSQITNKNINFTFGPNILSTIKGSSIIEAGLDKYNKIGSDDVFSLYPFYLQQCSASNNSTYK